MAALTKDRITKAKFIGRTLTLKVAAEAVIHSGAIVALNATGWAVPAAATADFTVIGIAQEAVDNTGGSNGDKTVRVQKGSFQVDNDGTNAVAQAHVGKNCFIADDQTVDSDGGVNNIVAGVVDSFDADGVYVYFA